MQYISLLEAPEKIPKKSVKIHAYLHFSCRSSGTIFTDPQGNEAHKSVQILNESSTWENLNISTGVL